MNVKHVLGALAAGVTSALTVMLILDDPLREAVVHFEHTYLVLLKGASLDLVLGPGTVSFLALFLFLGIVGGLAGAAVLVSVARAGSRMSNTTGAKDGLGEGEAGQDISVSIAALGGVMGAVFFFFIFLLVELAMDK